MLLQKTFDASTIPYSPPVSSDKVVWDQLSRLSKAIALLIPDGKSIDSEMVSEKFFVHPYDRVLHAWTKVLELRDCETLEHTRRVTDLSVELARSMGLEEQEIVHMRRGAMLHDIGKLGIPDKILLKAGPLNEEEREIMQQHPVYAYMMLSPIEFLQPALDIPLSHHERFDGFGYPYGLEGENIPLSARIFAIVDVWDALNSRRPYRKEPWPTKKILRYMRFERGRHFDPDVVDAFMRLAPSNYHT